MSPDPCLAVGDWDYDRHSDQGEVKLATIGDRMLKSSKLVGMKWAERPITNIEMLAIVLSNRIGERRYTREAQQWCVRFDSFLEELENSQ